MPKQLVQSLAKTIGVCSAARRDRLRQRAIDGDDGIVGAAKVGHDIQPLGIQFVGDAAAPQCLDFVAVGVKRA